MYLDYFRFKEFPFVMTPDASFFCHLKGHQEALDTILFSLRSGEGFIKITGEVGSGKTLLCRKLLDSLEKKFFTAWIPNPDLNPVELRRALARELGVDLNNLLDQHELLNAINQKLLQLHADNRQPVLLLDEAQALSDDSLEALRLLTNLETHKTRLLQVVLFGQPELDERLNQQHLRQLKQRISFSCFLSKLDRKELDTYLFHRLAIAGNMQTSLFTKRARSILYRASQGTPRLINILCHKALLIAYGKGKQKINSRIIKTAIADTEAAILSGRFTLGINLLFSLGVLLLLAVIWWFL